LSNQKNIIFYKDNHLYSNLKASIGFIFAAFLAGHTQNITPVQAENTTATIRVVPFNKAGTPTC
jgi:hypothetical protein